MVIRSLYGSADLSSAEFDTSFGFEHACKLVTVYIHCDEAITEEVTISLDSEKGSDYDTVIKARTLQSETDYVFAAQGDIALNELDKVRVQVSNANTLGNVFVSVKVEV